jgi:hypothetical protein
MAAVVMAAAVGMVAVARPMEEAAVTPVVVAERAWAGIQAAEAALISAGAAGLA